MSDGKLRGMAGSPVPGVEITATPYTLFESKLAEYARAVRFSAPGADQLHAEVLKLYRDAPPAPPAMGEVAIRANLWGVEFGCSGRLEKGEDMGKPAAIVQLCQAVIKALLKAIDSYRRADAAKPD